LLSVQRPVEAPTREINLRSAVKAQLFGSAQEPIFFFFLCGGFHGLFFGAQPFVSFCRPFDQKPAQQGGQRE